MRSLHLTEELSAAGLRPSEAETVREQVDAVLRRHRNPEDADAQIRIWSDFQDLIRSSAPLQECHRARSVLYDLAYRGRDPARGPGPAWIPPEDALATTHLGQWMTRRGLTRYRDLHRWSVEHREDYWRAVIEELGIVFRTPPRRILDPRSDPTHPDWLPGAELNIAESCFRADPTQVAIVSASEADPTLRRMTYGDLRRLASRVAHGLESVGVRPGERIALDLPMTPESVAIYLGTILAGRSVVGVADASAPLDVEKRVRIGGAKAVFTIDSYVRDGKEHGIYEKVVEGHAPRAVVLPAEGHGSVRLRRAEDLSWEDFLGGKDSFEAVPGRPSDVTNVLFSSGTTKDPKAILWTQATPIKSAADAYLHHDVGPEDVLAWPTSFGWMMGPWLTYGSLVNCATMALYVGAAQRRAFGRFVSEAGVSMLGVVPKLVRGWKEERSM
ncbi:MAG TPA: AMP-binding protein, partial [Thermoplasmata archaeon]|nr:AMP-binding protein [Thermoplasmata archaeon]